jgi:hypothetical protein
LETPLFQKEYNFNINYYLTSFLQFDTYQDAANPHGKTINAFKIVKGWRVRYMLWLFAAGVLGSICVVAIVTAMNQSCWKLCSCTCWCLFGCFDFPQCCIVKIKNDYWLCLSRIPKAKYGVRLVYISYTRLLFV